LAEDPRSLPGGVGDPSSPPAKTFERKNSFLGKIFKGSSGRKRTSNCNQRPVILTFSAQFPPPELSDDHHATYQVSNFNIHMKKQASWTRNVHKSVV